MTGPRQPLPLEDYLTPKTLRAPRAAGESARPWTAPTLWRFDRAQSMDDGRIFARRPVAPPNPNAVAVGHAPELPDSRTPELPDSRPPLAKPNRAGGCYSPGPTVSLANPASCDLALDQPQPPDTAQRHSPIAARQRDLTKNLHESGNEVRSHPLPPHPRRSGGGDAGVEEAAGLA